MYILYFDKSGKKTEQAGKAVTLLAVKRKNKNTKEAPRKSITKERSRSPGNPPPTVHTPSLHTPLVLSLSPPFCFRISTHHAPLKKGKKKRLPEKALLKKEAVTHL
jgi:hypothetical protein